MRAIVSLFVMCISVSNVFCQDMDFLVGVGMNNAVPPDLVQRNEQVLEYLMFPVELNEDFPVRLKLQTGLNVRFDYFNYGIIYSYYSTGSRLSYSDYSGEYYNDIICVWENISPSVTINLFRSKHFYSGLYFSVPINRSVVRFEEYIHVNDYENSFDTTFYANSIALSGGLEASLHYPYFNITIRGSYLRDMGAELHSKNDKEGYMYDYNGYKMSLDWSSLAFDLILGIRLFRFGSSP